MMQHLRKFPNASSHQRQVQSNFTDTNGCYDMKFVNEFLRNEKQVTAVATMMPVGTFSAFRQLKTHTHTHFLY